MSNYFYNTGKALSLIINTERVHNNIFHEGVEDFFSYQLSGDEQWLHKAITQMELANQMAYSFGTIDQFANLSDSEFEDKLLDVFQPALNGDRADAALMGSRLKLLMWLKPARLAEAQQYALQVSELGQSILEKVLAYKNDTNGVIIQNINADLAQMRGLYGEFAQAIEDLNTLINRFLFGGILLVVFLLVLTNGSISIRISRSISEPIRDMVEQFGLIAKGDLTGKLSIQADNEIGELANSFRQIQEGFRQVIAYTQKVADGDYSSQIVPKSPKDEMSISLNKMVATLQATSERNEQEDWLKSGINSLNEKLSNHQTYEEIGQFAISFLMERLHAQLGSVHLYEPDRKCLRLLSSSGFDPKKLNKSIRLNEGIIGQVAHSREMVVLHDLPDESYQTFSSSGEYKPRQIVIVPLIYNQTLIGVVELASLSRFSEIEMQFFRYATEIIGIKLNSVSSLMKTQELLEKTQQQASELQVQQEELRVANEELVEHTKVLTENEKKLQVQQEELRVTNEELEERSRQLEIQKEDISTKNTELTEAHQALEIKAKELHLASQYKSEFLANMSHELRTPLNSLLILSNMLATNKKGNLTGDQVQSAKIIHKSGTDLLQLINEVLDLSKIEAGKMTVVFAPVSATDLKDEILMSFNAMAAEKQLAFEVQVDPSFPARLKTDRYRLMQIVKNLLSNAFKFTSSGKITVDMLPTASGTIFNNSDFNSANSCCIRIADTGIGIPAEKLEAIFEAFQQADGSISRKFGGTGLGLSISRELIRLLGGEIQLESQVNKGSTFYVYLPVDKALTDEQPLASSISTADDSTAPNDHHEPAQQQPEPVLVPFIEDDRDKQPDGKTILVIHPSKQQARKFMQQARAKAYSAIVAGNIDDGILLAEKYQPKAILLAVEYARAESPGYQKLKQHRLTSKLPVHLITPIDYSETDNYSELPTVETISVSDALSAMENPFPTTMKKMLLVEDNSLTRTVIKTMLNELQLEIAEVQMAQEAYQLLCREKFDCIVLDLGLPDYSGKELLQKLRANGIPIPKVFIYTGKDISSEEIKELTGFTDTIILKGMKSDERLMDELTLFLHQLSKTIPASINKTAIASDESLFKGKKILIVDDDIRNVFALGQMLEERDMEVYEAENGQVAVDLLQSKPDIDLVLMDVMMPVMDGYEAMRIIRHTPGIQQIPVICLTAKAMKEDKENALKNGANDYLSKPLNEEKLFSMLKIWLYRN
ncbi:response regulator [Mangrovibacterium marinum]|uniref:response regulator n=1 Tax=Mangrovibacterium marinum TaxID=1639118 RepID=UPI00147549F8|nr:response regulator [Mangrovibacterium marinum]